MRMFRRVTIGMVLAGVAAPGYAATVDREHLAQCKSDLKGVYGDDTRLKLKSIKRKHRSQGDHMRIQAVSADGERHYPTCWVDSEGATHMVDSDGVALAAPEFDSAEKLSLND